MDTTTAHPRPLTSAHLQAWGLGTANEGAQQQLQRGPGRGKLCLTLRGQGGSSENPHVANVPSPVVQLTNTSLSLEAPPPLSGQWRSPGKKCDC